MHFFLVFFFDIEAAKIKAKSREKRTGKKTEGYVIHYSILSHIIKQTWGTPQHFIMGIVNAFTIIF